MDRALKERIIGAAVLVVFAVLVVPVFLDGPPEDGEVVEKRVPLPGQEAAGEERTVVLERDRDEPVPAALLEPEPEPERPEPAASQPQAESKEPLQEPDKQDPPQQAEKTDPPPREAESQPTASSQTSSTGMWAVQLGSFGNQQNAERLAADLRKQGFAAFLSPLPTDSGQMQRVRIGPQKDRESAEAMAARLEKAGHKGQVVPHP